MLPKSAIENLDWVKVITFLDAYIDKYNKELILKPKEINEDSED